MNSWWETPLCARFLEKIKNEIFAGKIVLVFIPRHAPDRFIPQLKTSFEKENKFEFIRINLDECKLTDSKPVESLLYSHFELDRNTDSFIQKNAIEIFENIDYKPTQIFVLENLQRTLLVPFKEFIFDLGRFLARIPIYERYKIVVNIEPSRFKYDDFMLESGVEKIHFQGIFGKLDFFLGLRYYYGQDSEIVGNLKENMIAVISQFDVRLAKELVESDDFFKEYNDVLTKYAEKRGWQSIKYKDPIQLTEQEKWERWSNGILEIKDNKIHYHSAFLKIHNKNIELNKRNWISGIEVLIPMIEEFRNRVLQCNKLIFPFKCQNRKTGELKENKLDFEIGDISYLTGNREITFRWLSPIEKSRIIEFIHLSKEIRNDLSHLKLPKTEFIIKFYSEYNAVDSTLDSVDMVNT